jgi:predicted DCC family thiol-disulfide oxidoreductase YuxK
MRATLLYDADCGFCTRTARWLEARAIGADVIPIGTAHLDLVDARRAEREVPFVDAAGRVSYGAAAIVAALRHCPPRFAWVGAVCSPRLIRPVLDAIYAVVARNRHRLPGGTAMCSLGDAPRSSGQRTSGSG